MITWHVEVQLDDASEFLRTFRCASSRSNAGVGPKHMSMAREFGVVVGSPSFDLLLRVCRRLRQVTQYIPRSRAYAQADPLPAGRSGSRLRTCGSQS
jgi:hypothetical protein